MKIVVCVRPGADGEIGPFDAAALECALRVPGAEAELLSMAPPKGAEVLLRLTRLGAKHAYLLSDPVFAGSDTLATSYVLSLALKRLKPDLVLCGRKTLEGDTGQVGAELAERCGYSLAAEVLEILGEDGGGVRVRTRENDEKRVTYPALLCMERVAALRFPGIFSKPGDVTVWNAADLGADVVVQGGQTMNPSTEDMLNAVDHVNADSIFILPNNKNIILAAEQARDLTEDKKIIVLPTKTIPQGISAMIGYMPEAGVDENEENMKEAYQDIASGQVTYAVRDTVIDGKEIHNGDIMGINDDGIAAVGKNLTETTLELLSTMADEDSELICLYYGADVTKDDADTLSDAIEDKFPECEVEVNFGGQPIYYYMISVE